MKQDKFNCKRVLIDFRQNDYQYLKALAKTRNRSFRFVLSDAVSFYLDSFFRRLNVDTRDEKLFCRYLPTEGPETTYFNPKNVLKSEIFRGKFPNNVNS